MKKIHVLVIAVLLGMFLTIINNKAYAAAPPGSIFYDDFLGLTMDSAKWHIPHWTGPTDGTFKGRTQDECDQNAGLPTVSGGNANITVQTYNPTGSSFYGYDLISNQSFSPGSNGLTVTFRAKLGQMPGGIVNGLFLYSVRPENGALHDEIDFELLSNDMSKFSTNIYGDEPLGFGHPATYSYLSGLATDWHVYQIKWESNQVTWLVDGVVFRTVANQSPIPAGPMYVYINMWVPSSDFAAAYNASLNYTTSPSANHVYTSYIDYVQVQQMLVPALTTINVSPINATLIVGETKMLTATMLDQAGDPFPAAVVWHSDNPSIATIDPIYGLITALTAGTANIIATSGSVTSSPAVITVNSPIANNYGIQITKVPALGSGGSAQGIITGMNSSDYPNYGVAVVIYIGGGWWTKPYFASPMTTIQTNGTWSANITTGGNDTWATVVHAYLVPSSFDIPLLSGSEAIPSSLTAFPFARILRTSPVATSIVVSPASEALSIGETQQLTAKVNDQFGNNYLATVVWQSSSPGVASVNSTSGLVSAISPGTANITATSGSITSSPAVIDVAQVIVPTGPRIYFTGLPVYGKPGKATGWVDLWGGQAKYFKVLVFINVNGQWWTKPYYNKPETKISNSGNWSANIVTGGNDAEATEIRAYVVPTEVNALCNGSYVLPSSLDWYYYASITRTPALVGLKKIITSPKSMLLEYGGDSQQITAVAQNKYKQPMDANITWLSSNPKVAVVDQNGNVYPWSRGSTTIRATSANIIGLTVVKVR